MSIDRDILRHIVSGAIGFVVLAYLTNKSLRSPPDRDGWHRIQPSTMQWVALLGSGALASLMLYVRVFVGSSRADADSQMMAANGLIAGFFLSSAFVFRQIKITQRLNVFWRQSTLCFTTSDGRERLLPMTDIIGIRESWSGWLALRCKDETIIWLDQYARGTRELCSRIVEVSHERHYYSLQ
jgi:hypothetical protein